MIGVARLKAKIVAATPKAFIESATQLLDSLTPPKADSLDKAGEDTGVKQDASVKIRMAAVLWRRNFMVSTKKKLCQQKTSKRIQLAHYFKPPHIAYHTYRGMVLFAPV